MKKKLFLLFIGRKAILSVLGLVLLLSATIPAEASERRGIISLAINYLVYSDSRCRDVYSKGELCPEVKAGYKVYRDFYIWESYGYLSAEGTTPVLKEETSLNYHYLSIGAGYNRNFSEKLNYLIELGLLNVIYKEEAMGEKASGLKLGFRFGVGIIYNINKTFFAELSTSYLHAVDNREDISIKFGGFKAGVGFGVGF